MYRGLLFLAERRLETFINVTLFVQILQKFWTDTLSEEIITCFTRAEWFSLSQKYGKVSFKKEISAETLMNQWGKLN